MACLKMVLAARTGAVHPTLALARLATEFGGYVEEEGGNIRGLIYAPFVTMLAERFGIESEVVTGITAGGLPAILRPGGFFMASVHPSIRWGTGEPPKKGGHLVLVLAASANEVMFHNPSGHDEATQRYARLPLETFDAFFAGRGVFIPRHLRKRSLA